MDLKRCKLTLDDKAKSILDACARVMVVGGDVDEINPYPLLTAFQRAGEDAIISFLAERVKHYDSNEAIRRADPALFLCRVKGINLYLVLCPSDTPEGEVTELNENMLLVSLGPYSNGFDIGADPASRGWWLET